MSYNVFNGIALRLPLRCGGMEIIMSKPSTDIKKRQGRFARGTSSFCTVAALVIFLLVMLYLFVNSLIGTVDMNMDNSMLENVEYHWDDFILGLLTLVLATVALLLCRRLLERINLWILVGASVAIVLIVGCVWVSSSLSAPTHDSLIVSRAAYYLTEGDSSYLAADYFKRFPFQLGYVLFSEIFIRLLGTADNYLAIEFVNVFFLAISYFAMLMMTRRLFKSDSVTKVLAVLIPFCLQPILFCTFTYGNIPGLAFALLALWQFCEMREGWRGWLHGFLCALCLGISVSIKKNFMIVLVAFLIIGLLRLILKRRLCELVCLLLCVVSVLGVSSAVKAHYEARTGIEFGDGIPMVSWLAMGLNESAIAPGWYNGIYTVTNFHSHDMDPDAAADASVEVIKERIEAFSADPQYTRDFFAKKITSQWNEPTYQSLWTNQVRGRYGEMGKLATFALVDGEARVKSFMDGYVELIFALTALAAVLLIGKREVDHALLPTVILGGFIYHALFEAKSQYAIVYLVLMLPLAAYAIEELYIRISALIKEKKSAPSTRSGKRRARGNS